MFLYVCKQTFRKLYRYITREFLVMQDFQVINFIGTQIYREIFKSAFVYLLYYHRILKKLFTILSWKRLIIGFGVRFFWKNNRNWMDYRLALPDLKIINLQFLLIVDNDVSCHVTWEISRDNPRAKNVFGRVNVWYPLRKQRLLNLLDCAEWPAYYNLKKRKFKSTN